ncbi:hypothetical protein LV779_33950 [Streptomyces thinghirensis]|nr:hypothetical protein [Streptomyces thinghirensis]
MAVESRVATTGTPFRHWNAGADPSDGCKHPCRGVLIAEAVELLAVVLHSLRARSRGRSKTSTCSRRTCPDGAGGYGSRATNCVNLDDEEAVGLGGVGTDPGRDVKAAKQLGWKVITIGWIGTRNGTMVAAVQDTREVPDEHRAVVDAAMNEPSMRAALHKVWGAPGPAPVQLGLVPG